VSYGELISTTILTFHESYGYKYPMDWC
jgi:hypothetical protein